MRKIGKKLLSLGLAVSMVFSGQYISGVTDGSNYVSAATKIKINKKTANIYVGKTVQLKVTGTKKKVTWKSSNKKVATVTSKGKVKGIKKGTAKITATVSKKKYICKVTVKEITNNVDNNEVASTTVPTRTPVKAPVGVVITPPPRTLPTPPSITWATATPSPVATSTTKPVETKRPTTIATVSPTKKVTSTPSPTPTPIDNLLHNPTSEPGYKCIISTWDLVEYGQYPQSSYLPIIEPDEPEDNKTYVDSNGVSYLCRETKTTVKSSVFNEDTQKYEVSYNDVIKYHYFKYEPILWRVLNVTDNDVFLVSDKCIDYKKFDYGGKINIWENCSIRTWLNNSFKNIAFNDEEQKNIINTHVYSRGNPNNILSDDKIGNDTDDYIFLLDIYEVTKKEYGFGIDDDIVDKDYYNRPKSLTRCVLFTDFTSSGGTDSFFSKEDDTTRKVYTDWWLRSPYGSNYKAAFVESYGSVNCNPGLNSGNVDYSNGIRPALHIDITKTTLKKVGTVNSKNNYVLFQNSTNIYADEN